MIHPGFVNLSEIVEGLILEMSYSTSDNFTGGVVPGYNVRKAYLALEPAKALAKVQEKARREGMTLKIFDSYRPVKAVQYFQSWAKLPETNPDFKKRFYPHFERLELFEKGFIAKQSSHSRGCAVDLTLVKNDVELDMGSEFDYFHELSFTDSPDISEAQRKNRMLLKDMMESEGFRNFYQEWWHYSFRPEPFPDQPFDFDIE